MMTDLQDIKVELIKLLLRLRKFHIMDNQQSHYKVINETVRLMSMLFP